MCVCVKENDIFLGWEKGAGKKWGKSKKKSGTDLSLEEMKKQAAVQCLRSASDEVRPRRMYVCACVEAASVRGAELRVGGASLA